MSKPHLEALNAGLARRRPIAVRLVASLVLLSTALLLPACDNGDSPANKPSANTPTIPISELLERATYVGRDACVECHQEEANKWAGSHHDMAMKRPTDKTVVGDFNNTSFEHFGLVTSFSQKDGNYYVETEGPTGQMETYKVKWTFGIEPLQQYLIEFPDGRVQCLNVAWDTVNKKWFSVYPDERIKHDDRLHWTGLYQNWNHMCADCHSTDVRKNFDVETNTFDTTFREINVGCEACHGPGSEHVKWARAASKEELAFGKPQGLTTKLKGKENAKAQVDACAQCHSRRRVVYPEYKPGKPFLDHYTPSRLSLGLYHPDGQIQDEVYVYGSFLQSKMYHKDVRCADCHDPHTTKLLAEGNNLCIRCHDAQKFNGPQHHFHPVESKGAQCVECHMRDTTYMVVDPRRDHSFQLPRPDLTVKLGLPNACNDCHNDQTPQWAADHVVKWYGPNRPNDPHFAVPFEAARRARLEALPQLITIARDAERPAIVRATAIELMAGYDMDDAADTIFALLNDPEPLVRGAAAEMSQALQPVRMLRGVTPLLDDRFRYVRMEAARALLPFMRSRLQGFSSADTERFHAVLEELSKLHNAMGDQPATHLHSGSVREMARDLQGAEADYRMALRLDPLFFQAYVNLAELYRQQQQFEKAEQAYRDAIRSDPTHPQARVNLARFLNERGQADEAEKELREAVKLTPDTDAARYLRATTLQDLALLVARDDTRYDEAQRLLKNAIDQAPNQSRLYYNLGQVLRLLKRTNEAEQVMKKALELRPTSTDYVNALAHFYYEFGRHDEAVHYIERLQQLAPADPQVRQWVQQFRAARDAAKDGR